MVGEDRALCGPVIASGVCGLALRSSTGIGGWGWEGMSSARAL